MKVLIVGLGSIASKHIIALRMLEPEAEIFALRSGLRSDDVEGVTNLKTWDEIPANLDFIIISNPPSEHYSTIMKASDTGLPLFIEKPPLSNLDGIGDLLKKIRLNNNSTYVAFVLRFHPVIKWLKENLDNKKVLEVQSYCGSYLPDWRPDRDYRKSYSANRFFGGGVHLDLLHEIDYIRFIFGDPASYNAFFSKVSMLDINSFDSAHYLLSYDRLNIYITLNYFRKDSKRFIEIVMNEESITADLINCKIVSSTGNILFEDEPDNIKMYRDQLKHFLDCLQYNRKPGNDLEYSLNTLSIALGK